MLKYKNPENNEVYAYSEDQKHIIPDNFIAITDEEAENIIYQNLLLSNKEQKINDCYLTAKLRLNETDYTQLTDVELLNKQEFSEYRAKLRQILKNPVEDPQWPDKPSARWAD